MMERKIGEKFEYEPGVWLEVVVDGSSCSACYFDKKKCDTITTGACALSGRSDGKSVIFTQCSAPVSKPIDKTAELEARILRLEQILSLEPVVVDMDRVHQMREELNDAPAEAWSRARREAIDENFKKNIDKLSQ